MTGTLKARVGGAWVPILGSGQDAAAVARWNSAWGTAGFTVGSGGFNLPTTETAIASVTVPVVAGRRYNLTADMALYRGSGWGVYFRVRLTNVSGTVVVMKAVTSTDPNDSITLFSTWDCTTTGNQVFVLTANGVQADVATDSSYGPRLYVEDVGPVTPVSIAPPTGGPRVVASGNALGIVAMGALNQPNPVIAQSTYGNVTQDLPVFWAVGRRYRVVLSIRATSTSAYPSGLMCRLSINPGVPTTEKWRTAPTSYQGFDGEWVFDGDGIQHSLSCQMQSPNGVLTVYTDITGWFYCEDIGPNTSPALPIPATPPPWSPLTLQNGWVSGGSIWSDPSYRKIGDIVSIRGALTAGSPGTILFTMPVGFRPPPGKYISNPSCAWNGSATVFGRGYIDNNGAYWITDGPTSSHVIDFSYSTTA
jgi:hypothetical protein